MTRNNLLTIGNGEIRTQSNTGTETIFEEERKHDENTQVIKTESKKLHTYVYTFTYI